jgi:surface polysaccharide O-acyltransferase-like enzyme
MISENTLPIFLFHMIVIYTLQQGLLGITLNGDVVNSIIGVPLMALLTLAICLAILVPLKKVPVLKRLIG